MPAEKRARLTSHVLKAMGNVPGHEFVPEREREHAYENRPLPIGYGQTISQPTIVALMTELLDVKKEDVVLEVGTGSGYQAAVLTECAKQVYSFNDYRLKAGRLSRAYTSGKAKAIYGYSDESDSSLRSPSSTLAASSQTLKVWGSSDWFAMYCWICSSVTAPTVEQKYPRLQRYSPQYRFCRLGNSLCSR
jgi:hypothetical protein